MRILHASDPHIRKTPKDNDEVRGKLAKVQAMLGQDDVFVLTGDVTDDGTELQYQRALELLLPFAGRIVLVPGNHDFGPLGNFYDPACVRRFAKLKQQLKAEKPWMIRIDGLAVGEIIVLDTNRRSGTPIDFAQGEVGWWNRVKLKRKLEAMQKAKAVSVIAMHHNPFYEDWFCKLVDAKQFMDVVLGRADIVLMGHEHKYRHSWYPMNLPEEMAKTKFWAADALFHAKCEILTIPLMSE